MALGTADANTVITVQGPGVTFGGMFHNYATNVAAAVSGTTDHTDAMYAIGSAAPVVGSSAQTAVDLDLGSYKPGAAATT